MPRFLIVEDSEALREILHDVVVDLGHEVISVADGTKALEALAVTDFSFALVDLNLPDMTGFDIIRRFVGNPSTPRPCFVLMTGQIDKSVETEALAAGFDHRLSKPFGAEDVESLVARWQSRPVAQK